jgi:phage shock protein A
MSFFNYLFGKPVEVKKEPAPTPHDTITNLINKEKDLEKKIDYTRIRIQQLTEQAKTTLAKGDKTKALLLLKQKAGLEDQEKSYTAMLDKLSHQRLTVEMGMMQVETFKTMKQTNEYLKQSEGKMDADKAQDIVDDYDDHVQNQTEMTRIITAPLPGTEHLQDEAEAELAKMMAEQENPIVKPKVEVKQDETDAELEKLLSMLPQVPTTDPSTVGTTSTDRVTLAM